jgi:hypothetical protein
LLRHGRSRSSCNCRSEKVALTRSRCLCLVVVAGGSASSRVQEPFSTMERAFVDHGLHATACRVHGEFKPGDFPNPRRCKPAATSQAHSQPLSESCAPHLCSSCTPGSSPEFKRNSSGSLRPSPAYLLLLVRGCFILLIVLRKI